MSEIKPLGRDYSIVIDKFLRKIKKDRKFFNYRNCTDDEIMDIINERSLDILDSALNGINNRITPLHGINFDDRDDELKCFNFDLYRSDVELIVESMRVEYYEEEEIKLNRMEKYLGNDIKTYCPADERNSFMSMLNTERNELQTKIEYYNSRDRITNQPIFAY